MREIAPGREVAVDWHGRTVRAWLADPLAGRRIELAEPVVRATERAAAAVRSVGALVPAGFEPLARLLLRAEGLASSFVEGIAAPPEDVVLAEAGASVGIGGHVADNLHAVEEGLDHAAGAEPLTADVLHELHRRTMVHGGLPEEFVGDWRPVVGWIGGSSPLSAVFVPAPPDAVPGLMADLVEVANDPPWDPVTAAAIVHAQFETIHPYADGNGRVGRVLALWVLTRHLEGVEVPPPISALIARDVDAYLAALGAFRLGADDRLVAWFAEVVTAAAALSARWAERLAELVADWERRTARLRADATARRMLGMLAASPVVSAAIVADRLGVSLPAARIGAAQLVELGVLEDRGVRPAGPGRPQRWWSAPELLALVGGWASS